MRGMSVTNRLGKPRRRSSGFKDASIADVPTVLPEADNAGRDQPVSDTAAEESADEAVRRMVEAAYT